MSDNKNTPPATKAPKKKGPLRTEAIVPITIIVAATYLYFHLFFDTHLKLGLEYAGYNIVGAQVDVSSVKTSFIDGSLRIQGIDITDPTVPSVNLISIGDIRYSVLWDALLRAKFVVNEAAIEQIEFNKPRKSPGRVKPPEPPEPESTEPSEMEKQANQIKDKALAETQERAGENILGDILSVAGGGKSDVQLDKLNSHLLSEEKAQAIQASLNNKQKEWQDRLKALPQAKDFQALSDRLNKVKTSNFNSPQELQASLQEIDVIFKEADAKYKELQTASSDFNSDLKKSQLSVKELEDQIKSDVKQLEQHFKIPQLDAKSITMAVFKQQFAPYLEKVNYYRGLFKKYAPPNLVSKSDNSKPDVNLQPRPREKGISYEFGKPNSYPLVWIKKTIVSSQAGATPLSGNIKGQILDISSNQILTGKPTVAKIEGSFPAQQIEGLLIQLTLNNTKPESLIDLTSAISYYPVAEKKFVSSEDVKIGFKKASGSMNLKAELKGYKEIHMKMENLFKQVEYDVSAKSKDADQMLKNIFYAIPQISVTTSFVGILPRVNLDISSNIGPEIQKGFQKELQAKIDEARKKIEAYVNEQVAKQKAQIDAQIKQIQSQFEGELKKIQDQAEAQKKQATAKTEEAKKDAENKARAQAEAEKQKLEQEKKKLEDELKKRFGR